MDDLIPQIEAFCRAHGLTESQFGRAALKDTSLVSDMRDGRELRRATRDKLRMFMVEYRPEKAAA